MWWQRRGSDTATWQQNYECTTVTPKIWSWRSIVGGGAGREWRVHCGYSNVTLNLLYGYTTVYYVYTMCILCLYSTLILLYAYILLLRRKRELERSTRLQPLWFRRPGLPIDNRDNGCTRFGYGYNTVVLRVPLAWLHGFTCSSRFTHLYCTSRPRSDNFLMSIERHMFHGRKLQHEQVVVNRKTHRRETAKKQRKTNYRKKQTKKTNKKTQTQTQTKKTKNRPRQYSARQATQDKHEHKHETAVDYLRRITPSSINTARYRTTRTVV